MGTHVCNLTNAGVYGLIYLSIDQFVYLESNECLN